MLNRDVKDGGQLLLTKLQMDIRVCLASQNMAGRMQTASGSSLLGAKAEKKLPVPMYHAHSLRTDSSDDN